LGPTLDIIGANSSIRRNAIIRTLYTGKKVKARIIYFIGTAGPVVHDDNKFFEHTDFTLCQRQLLCISRKLYHHLPDGVGKKIAEFGPTLDMIGANNSTISRNT
jgi:hypothetical protein